MDIMSRRAIASHKAMARILLHGDFLFFFSITTQHTYSNETVLFGQNYWPYSNEYPIEKEAMLQPTFSKFRCMHISSPEMFQSRENERNMRRCGYHILENRDLTFFRASQFFYAVLHL